MSSQQDPATGTITGAIPDQPPTCFACGDDLAEMIDIRELSTDKPAWLCKDRVPCMERSAKREADKFLTAEWFAEHGPLPLTDMGYLSLPAEVQAAAEAEATS